MAIQNYYNNALNYFNSLDERVKGLLNAKWRFGFEFFPDQNPANIEYSRMPKNGLVLTSIWKGNKFDYSTDELEEYSRLLNVDCLPVIFKGKLSQDSVDTIKYFLNTSPEDLEYVFGEKSFAYFFYKLLNPQLKNSFLMGDDDYQKNLQKLIIKTHTGDVSFSILNPLYKRVSDSNQTEYLEVYTLILVNFLNFCQSIDLSDLKIKGNTREEAYIYLICKLFNMYVDDVKNDLINFEFTIPEFFNREKFRINKNLITNKLTKGYLNENKKLEYIFKVILGSFNKRKKKALGVFTDETVVLFNSFVEEIANLLDIYLGKKTEIELNRDGLLDFDKFNLKFKVETDADGQIYPSIEDELTRRRGEEKKGKGKKGIEGLKGKSPEIKPEL